MESPSPLKNTPVRHMVPGKLAVICNFNNSSLAKAVVASNSISLQLARQLKDTSTNFQ